VVYDGFRNVLKDYFFRLATFDFFPTLPPYPDELVWQPPQIDQLPVGDHGKVRLDALLVSIGANDLGFSKILTDCATQGAYQYAHQKWPFVFSNASCKDSKAGQDFREAQGLMAERYEALNAALAGRGIPSNRIYITGYFNPTHDSDGSYCSASGFHPFRTVLTIHRKGDLQWAEQTVLKTLNDDVKSAAAKFGWHFIGRIAAGFHDHGYCAGDHQGQSWMRSISGSFNSQHDYFGTMHPNNQGQRCYATRIWEYLYRDLYKRDPAQVAPPPGAQPECL
jgi:hypothetical protein